MKDEVFTCCICGALEAGWGNNPDGAAWRDYNDKGELVVVRPTFKLEDRCCDRCNQAFVIPGRILAMQEARQAEKN